MSFTYPNVEYNYTLWEQMDTSPKFGSIRISKRVPSYASHASGIIIFQSFQLRHTMSSTPPPVSTTPHQPPSLSNSPSVKRPRIMSPNESSTPVAPLSASPPLLVKKISPSARTPTRGSVYAAGYDLYASEATTIPARGRKLVSTGLQMAVVEGCCESPML